MTERKRPELPATATMADFQRYVHDLEAFHGWLDVDLVHNCFLMGEEVGELFKAVRKRIKLFDEAAKGQARKVREIPSRATRDRFPGGSAEGEPAEPYPRYGEPAKPATRRGVGRPRSGEAEQSRMGGGIASRSRDAHALFGQGPADDWPVAEELVDVLNYLLAIANRLDIDVEAAFRRKNEANLDRTWG